MADDKTIKITWFKSQIGADEFQKRTLRALGLRRLNHSVVRPDNESVRGMVATVRASVLLSLFTDFENFRIFKPNPQHEKELHVLLDQIVAWGGALKALRQQEAEEAAMA